MFLVVVESAARIGWSFYHNMLAVKAPKQFGNLHLIQKPSSTFFHLSRSGIGITSSDNAFQIAKHVLLTILCIVDIPTLKRALRVKYESPVAKKLQRKKA